MFFRAPCHEVRSSGLFGLDCRSTTSQQAATGTGAEVSTVLVAFSAAAVGSVLTSGVLTAECASGGRLEQDRDRQRDRSTNDGHQDLAGAIWTAYEPAGLSA